MYHLTGTNILAENQQAIIKSNFIQENTTPQEPPLHVKSDIFFLIQILVLLSCLHLRTRSM
jgi:hypothetical protein